MRKEKNYTGGNSLSIDFRPQVATRAVPEIVEKGVNENGVTLFFLDTGEAMTEQRYLHEYGQPVVRGKMKGQYHKGDNPDKTKINFKNT